MAPVDADFRTNNWRAFNGRFAIPRAAWLTIPLALASAGLLLIPNLVLRGGRFAPNLQIEGVPIGGRTMEQAWRAIQARSPQPMLTIVASPQAHHAKLIDFGGAADGNATLGPPFAVGRSGGFFKDLGEVVGGWRVPRSFPMRYAFHPQKLEVALKQVAWRINRTPQNARLEVVEGSLVLTPDVGGVRFEVAATAEEIQRNYAANATSIEAIVKTWPARIRLADLTGVDTPLVVFNTRYRAGESNRSSNIRLCARNLNGTLLMPGDSFSFNRVVGDRTPARGFKLAGMFVNGEKVQGFGGGVCQVSSTVFNAARNAELQIVERHPHSLPVPYVPQGGDATVVFPYSDLQFRNSSDTPLLLEATASGGKMTVRLWGRGASRLARSDETARYRVVHYPGPCPYSR